MTCQSRHSQKRLKNFPTLYDVIGHRSRKRVIIFFRAPSKHSIIALTRINISQTYCCILMGKRTRSPKKLVSFSQTRPFFRYDVISKEFGQIWVNPLIAVMRPLHKQHELMLAIVMLQMDQYFNIMAHPGFRDYEYIIRDQYVPNLGQIWAKLGPI